MRKLILAALIAVSIVSGSCQKEDPIFTCSSTCGQIISDNVYNYTVTIKNDCSGNYKTFTLSPADWTTAYVGTDYCITNTQPW